MACRSFPSCRCQQHRGRKTKPRRRHKTAGSIDGNGAFFEVLVILTTANIGDIRELTLFPRWSRSILITAWEQRKLGGIAPVTMGQSPNGACYTDNPNDAVLVQGNADLKDGWVFPRVWTTEITKTAKAGDLIMSVRAPVGAMGKTAYDVVLGRGVAGIAGNEFLFQALSKKEAEGYWSTVSAGSTFDSINGDELRNTPVDYPRSKPEREAVGSCLSRIDCLIPLHQREPRFADTG